MRHTPLSEMSPFGRLRSRVDTLAASSPARFATVVFGMLVLIFTGLLSLPIARRGAGSASFIDAFFTAMSTICVTGLSTVDMATYWTPFGHAVIFIGVEVGAVGVLTFASILGLVISRRLGLKQKLMAASDGNPLRAHKGPVAEGQAVRLGEIGGLLATVAASMLIIEAAIAVLLFPRVFLHSGDLLDSLWVSAYFSVMSFTNTGFVLSPDGLAPFATDPWFLTIMMVSVFLGAIGFPVIYVLTRNFRNPRRWSVHVKLTLVTSAILFVLGAIAFFALEFNNPKTFGGMDAGQRVLQSLFLSMMTRSGGFSTVPIADLFGSSHLVGDMLMFIGGGSASTAGGIKVTTLAVLFLAGFAEARGNEAIEAFDRRIPSDVLRVSVSIVLWGATIVAAASIIVLQITADSLERVLFDVISAFGTSGLSTGLTESAPPSAQFVIAITMFLGRVGTVTLAAALAASTRRQLFQRAEERPIVG